MQRENEAAVNALVFRPASACLGCRPPSLPPTEIHVWGILMQPDDTVATFLSCLSDDETQRASRLISAARRLEFLAARSALRFILAGYTGQPAKDLQFHLNEWGKPFLKPEEAGLIRFNMSHSHGRALIAVSRGREVGVDLETARPRLNIMQLAERFLGREDLACLHAADPAHLPALFRRLWVVREAVAKAHGTGLRFPLHEEHVELAAAASEGRVTREGKPGDTWARFIPMEGEWVGAVAAKGSDWRVVLCP